MPSSFSFGRLLAAFVAALLLAGHSVTTFAGEVLITDRLTNNVYRYSADGDFLGVLITGDPNLNQPSGIVVSPDLTKLYVSSSQNDLVVQYDYDYAAGTATNGTVFADATNGLSFPNDMKFSPDGSKLYVANLNGSGITQLNVGGGNAGPNLMGGSSFAFSGLQVASDGSLLAGGFDGGTVAKSNAGVTALSDFIGPDFAILGAAGVLEHEGYIYVSGLFTTVLGKYDAVTGAPDPTFNVAGLDYPQGLLPAPDGNGLLVGILGAVNGTGNISRFSTDGTLLDIFADHVDGTLDPLGLTGFHEATAFVYVVPEPSALVMAGMALAALGLAAKRRRTR